MQLQTGITLYHGSYTVVEKPLLEKCARHKDFGQGFYLTTSRDQARSFAKLSARKALANHIDAAQHDTGFVSTFRFDDVPSDPLLSHSFDTADAAWLHCIVAHRKAGRFPEVALAMADYDLISGKIANDQTNATIVAYMSNLFGPPGDPEADETCIRLLIPERLKDQHCFRTEKALGRLRFIESEQIRL